jgi:hypothetical protein
MASLRLHLGDARGRGIVMVVSAQSPSRLRSKWSPLEASTNLNAATVRLVFGGLVDTGDLEFLSKLSGKK